jgi:hypothetical protein
VCDERKYKNLNTTHKKQFTISQPQNFTSHLSHRKHKPDPELDAAVGDSKSSLLDSSAQKHKLAVKPKKRHASSVQKKLCPKPGER